MQTGIIILGGGIPPDEAARVVPDDAYVVAVDSGFDHALSLGLAVDLLIGDLDSISEHGLREAERLGVTIHRHPPAKDATDTELAIDAALAHGCTRLVAITAEGVERLDHLFATVLVFATPLAGDPAVTLWVGTTRIDVVRPGAPITVAARPGAVFSVLPIHGEADGVSIEGAEYPLVDALLPAGTSRGVSNVVGSSGAATVTVGLGRALVFTPSALEGQP